MGSDRDAPSRPRVAPADLRIARLPAPGEPFDWEAAFAGRAGARRVVDLGCGNAQYLIRSAAARQDALHLGIDLVPQAIAHALRRAAERGLTNVRLAVGDAYAFAVGSVAPASVDEVHIYHPQPYYDPVKRARRLLTPELVRAVWRGLRDREGGGGALFVRQSDNPAYWRYIERSVPLLFEWRPRAGLWPDAPEGRTLRESVALRKGLRVFRAEATPRRTLSEREADEILARLPEPSFDADKPRYRGRFPRRRGRERG